MDDAPQVSPATEAELMRLFDGVQSLEPFPDPSFPMFNQHKGGVRAGDANPELVALFDEGTDSVVLPFFDDAGIAVASLFRYPYDFFAAAMLGMFIAPERFGDGYADSVEAPAFFSVGPFDDIGESVMFRRGRYLYQVTPGPADTTAEAEANRASVHQLAAELYDAAPDGDHRPFFFASWARGAAESALLGLVLAALIIGYRVVRAGSAQLPSSPVVMSQSVDVTSQAGQIRSGNRRTVAAQALALVVTISVVAVAPEPWSFLVGSVVGLGTLVVTYLDTNSKGRRTLPRANAQWFVARMAATMALALGFGLLVRGLGNWLFTPGLDHTKLTAWLNTLGLQMDVVAVGQAMAALGIACLVVGGQLNRQARTLGRPRAAQVRAIDQRPEVLYLRSFEDDRVKIPVVTSSRQSFLEFYSSLSHEPFEDCIAWQLSDHGPVTAINQPGEPSDSLGAFREYLPDDQWQTAVLKRMDHSRLIVLTLGCTHGLLWELQKIFERGHGSKCVLVIPPLSPDELRQRWKAVCATLATIGAPVRGSVDPAAHMALAFDQTGATMAITSDRRDEAGYRAAITAAVRIQTVAYRSTNPVRERPERAAELGAGVDNYGRP